MNIANLTKMLENGLGAEYEYKGHRWMNRTIACGCTMAVCLDVEPTQEDVRLVSELFSKDVVLQTLLKESMSSKDEDVRKRFDEFKEESLKTKILLREFMDNKRKEHDFPIGTDFNSETYNIKLKQGANCKN